MGVLRSVPGILGGPTSFTLTDIASGRLFQRTKDLTTGPISASGTYSGHAPSTIQLQVLAVSDNSVVKDWTTASATIAGGTWSATITDVPQGGSYYVKVRPANAPGLAQTGSNPFYVGILVVMYGQSNMAYMSSTSSSPPAASTGTTYFNGSTWVAVPAANGVREMLNRLTALTGVPCAALNGAVAGHSVLNLSNPGDGSYANLIAQVTAAGGDAEIVIWNQGEEDSSGTQPTFHWTYVARVASLHSQLCTSIGRTTAQLPFVLGNLATSSSSYRGWQTIKRAIRDCDNSSQGRYFSHTHEDLANDGLHLTPASFGLSGKRFAQTVAKVLGYVATDASFFIASVAAVNSTTVDVTVTHNMGTDFTPTTGITGFEVSEDGGKTWIACTGVRQSATVIRLTHAATTRNRVLTYARGYTPDMSAPVRDNGAITTGLCGTQIPLEVDAVDQPFADFVAHRQASISTPWLSLTDTIEVGPGYTGRRFVFIGVYMSSAAPITAFSVNGVAATMHASQSTTPAPSYFIASIKDETATSLSLAFTFSSAMLSGFPFNVYELDESRFTTKTAPVANGYAEGAAATVVAATLNTTNGGVIMAIAASNNVTGNNPVDLTGSNLVEPWLTLVQNGHTARGEVGMNVPAATPETVTATFTNAGTIGIAATHWK